MVNNPSHNPTFLSKKIHGSFTDALNQMVIKYIVDNAVFTNNHVLEKLKDSIKTCTNLPIVKNIPALYNDESLAVYNITDKIILGKPDILLDTNSAIAVYYAENDLLRWAPRSAANNYVILAEGLILLMAVQYYLANNYHVQQSLFCLACKNAVQNALHNYITNNQLNIPDIFELHDVKKYCTQFGYDPQLFKQKHLQAKLLGATMVEADFTFLMFFGLGE